MNVSEGGEIDHRNGEKAREPGSKGRWEPGGKREGEGQCNGQKVCVLPQIHMLNSNPSVMVFGDGILGGNSFMRMESSWIRLVLL